MLSLPLIPRRLPIWRQKLYRDIIEDRGSRYTVLGVTLSDPVEKDIILANIRRDPYFRLATHNSWAYRIISHDGEILEGSEDDGETGAGQCILREMSRENVSGVLLVVTRYFGGVKLERDRYTHIVSSARYWIEQATRVESDKNPH